MLTQRQERWHVQIHPTYQPGLFPAGLTEKKFVKPKRDYVDLGFKVAVVAATGILLASMLTSREPEKENPEAPVEQEIEKAPYRGFDNENYYLPEGYIV